MKKYFINLWQNSSPRSATLITLTFLFWGLVWILVSDKLVDYLPFYSSSSKLLDFIFDLTFVIGSSIILYLLLKRGIDSIIVEREKFSKHDKLYKLITDNTDEVVWEYDLKNDKYIFISPSIEKLLGYTPAEMQSKSIKDILSKDFHYLYNDYLPKRIKDTENFPEGLRRFNYEDKLINSTGLEVCVDNTVYITRDKNGKALSLVGVTRNITEKKQQEEKLKYSESILMESQKIAEMGQYELDINKGIWYPSDLLKKIYGIDNNYTTDINGWLKIIHEEYRERMSNYLKNEVIKAKNNFDHVYKIRRINDGETRWIQGHGKLYFDEVGNPIRIIGVVQDITLRKMHEESIRESEERYRSVVSSIHEGIFMQNCNSEIITANNNAQKILGLSDNEIVSHNFWDKRWATIHEDGSPFPPETHPAKVTLKTGKPQTNVIMGLPKPEGIITWISINSEPLFMPDEDKPYAVVISFTDITERKNTEKKLKESEAKYRELVENNLAGVFRTSLKGEVLDCNTAFAQLFGHATKDVVMHKFAADYYPTYEYREKYVKLLFERGELKNFEYQRKKIDGTPIWTLENVRLIKNSDGAPVFLEGTIIDITARKAAEAQLIKERNQAQLYFEVAAVMFAHLDINGNITLMNKKGLEILECYDEEIIGKNWFDNFIPLENREQIRNIFKKSLAGKYEEVKYYENEIVSKTGKVKLLAFHNAIIKNENSEISGVLFSAEDITEKNKAIKELHESRTRLLKAQEVSHMGFLDWDLRTNKIFWSDEICRMFGRKPGENNQTIESTVSLTYPEDLEYVQENLEKAVKDEKRYDIDHRMLRPDGKIIWVHAQGELIKDEDGKPVTLLGTAVDITERKNAESALIESENRYRRLVEFSPDGFLIHQNGIIVFANKAALKMFCAKEYSELIGKNMIDFIHPDYKETVSKRIKLISENNVEVPILEEILLRLDGTFFYAEVVGIPSEYKGRSAVQVIYRDITERKKVENMLRESEQRLSLALEAANIGLFDWDLINDIWYANSIFFKMLGYKPELTKQNRNIWNTRVHPEDKQLVTNKILSIKESKEDAMEIEFRTKHADGSYRWVILVGRVIELNKDGSPKRMLGLQRDITERKVIESELREHREGLEKLVKLRTEELDIANSVLKEEVRKQKEIEMMLKKSLENEKELNELKTRFISTTSHEFRTPLTSVLTSIELIEMFGKKWSENKVKEHYSRIKNSVDHLTKLLDNILTISRSENGKIKFSPEKIDLRFFCSELLNETGLTLVEKDSFKFNYKLESKFIYADPSLLRFILINLLSNAKKYSKEEGHIEFTISQSKNFIEFLVKDNGIGILKEDYKYIFEPFHRGKNSLKIQGTGLGLSIAKRASELHGGEITFSSEPGIGTTFFVKIPKGNK